MRPTSTQEAPVEELLTLTSFIVQYSKRESATGNRLGIWLMDREAGGRCAPAFPGGLNCSNRGAQCAIYAFGMLLELCRSLRQRSCGEMMSRAHLADLHCPCLGDLPVGEAQVQVGTVEMAAGEIG